MKTILVRGPALSRSGYGEQTRFALRALRKHEERFNILLINTSWGQTGWISETGEERDWLDYLLAKGHQHTQQNLPIDISLQVTIPNEWERLAPINIGYTAGIETTKVAPQWIQKCNEMDKIITISQHSKQSLVNTIYEGVDQRTGEKATLRCVKEVDVVHYPVKKIETLPKLDLNVSTKFNFLTVAQWGPRKNMHPTIRWFVEEFIDNPEVGLIVKTFAKGGSVLDKYAMENELTRFLKKYENRKCKVYLMHGDLTDEEMHSLYKHKSVHALVSLTHGEGFGLPLFEAAYSGLPVVATDWSGHLDFLYMPVKDKKSKKEKMKEYKIQKSADNADHSDKGAKSPVSTVKSPNAASVANIAKGGADEKGRPAPTAQKMSDFENSPGKDKSTSYKKQGSADTADHSDKSAKSPVVSRK